MDVKYLVLHVKVIHFHFKLFLEFSIVNFQFPLIAGCTSLSEFITPTLHAQETEHVRENSTVAVFTIQTTFPLPGV